MSPILGSSGARISRRSALRFGLAGFSAHALASGGVPAFAQPPKSMPASGHHPYPAPTANIVCPVGEIGFVADDNNHIIWYYYGWICGTSDFCEIISDSPISNLSGCTGPPYFCNGEPGGDDCTGCDGLAPYPECGHRYPCPHRPIPGKSLPPIPSKSLPPIPSKSLPYANHGNHTRKKYKDGTTYPHWVPPTSNSVFHRKHGQGEDLSDKGLRKILPGTFGAPGTPPLGSTSGSPTVEQLRVATDDKPYFQYQSHGHTKYVCLLLYKVTSGTGTGSKFGIGLEIDNPGGMPNALNTTEQLRPQEEMQDRPNNRYRTAYPGDQHIPNIDTANVSQYQCFHILEKKQ